jgi:hypothetical protein
MHSHERRLAGSIIDDEFEVCFELLFSVVVLAKRRMQRGSVRFNKPVPYPRGEEKSTIHPTSMHMGYLMFLPRFLMGLSFV